MDSNPQVGSAAPQTGMRGVRPVGGGCQASIQAPRGRGACLSVPSVVVTTGSFAERSIAEPEGWRVSKPLWLRRQSPVSLLRPRFVLPRVASIRRTRSWSARSRWETTSSMGSSETISISTSRMPLPGPSVS